MGFYKGNRRLAVFGSRALHFPPGTPRHVSRAGLRSKSVKLWRRLSLLEYVTDESGPLETLDIDERRSWTGSA